MVFLPFCCRKMLKLCGETEDKLAQELIHFELQVERDVIEPLFLLAEVRSGSETGPMWLGWAEWWSLGSFGSSLRVVSAPHTLWRSVSLGSVTTQLQGVPQPGNPWSWRLSPSPTCAVLEGETARLVASLHPPQGLRPVFLPAFHLSPGFCEMTVESQIGHKWTYLWNRDRLPSESRLVVAKGEGI